MSGRRIGNYLISDYLGGGGFGSVFKAEDTSTPGRIVAIKELHKKHTRSAVIKQRFFQEAVAMARLDHVNLPRLYTFGEDNGSYYLVMEFLSGKLLTDEIQDQGQLPMPQALTIIKQVLEAVSYAHRNGIIHRDLKPDNIMLLGEVTNPKVKVLDFGIARMIGGENLTMAGEGFGTPTYMSPERIAGSLEPDTRADIYSLGIILYEMLSGKAPFRSIATDPMLYWSEMRTMHESHPMPSLAALGVADEVERIIRKATAKTVDYRYATADEMLADLLPASEHNTGAAANASATAAQLFVTTVPTAAEVYVDEMVRGASDATHGKLFIDALTPGLHSVRVCKSGYNEYRINVVLEDGKRTELQVPLAARSTVMMPLAGEATSPMDLQTVRMESGDNVATAMVMLEGIPAGSQVFVGAQALALAGDDGRATLQLAPGRHEVQVRTPTGETNKRIVTLTPEDSGSFRTMAMPFATGESPMKATDATRAVEGANITAPSKVASTVVMAKPQVNAPSPTKKRAAMAAAVVLLLGLAASAFFVLRKPNINPLPGDTTTAAQNFTPPVDAQATPATAPSDTAKSEAERQQWELQKKQLEAEKKALEKREQAIAEEKKGEHPQTETPVQEPAPTPPAPVEPAVSTPSQTTDESACVGVRVVGPGGQPAAQVKVVFVPSTGGGQQARTNLRGETHACGMIVGSQVRINVFALGSQLASRDVTVSSNRVNVSIMIERLPEGVTGAGNPDQGQQRRPPIQSGDMGPKDGKRGGKNFPFRKRPLM
ncbi:MAG: protein kinase [Acidobacteria bacterium]|nr:protein kinase [Acidobacteriota bacterium]